MRQQRTTNLRNQVTLGTPPASRVIPWQPQTSIGSTLIIVLLGSLEGMVLRPDLDLVIDGGAITITGWEVVTPSAYGGQGDLHVETDTVIPSTVTVAVPQNCLSIRNTWGGLLAPGNVQLVRQNADVENFTLIFASQAAAVVSLQSIPTLPLGSDGSTPLITNTTKSEVAVSVAVSGAYLDVTFPTAPDPGDTLELAAATQAVFNYTGGWLQPFVVTVP